MKKSNIISIVVFFIISFVVTFFILHFFVFEEEALLKTGIISLVGALGGMMGSVWINRGKVS